MGIAGTILAGAYLILTFPFGHHREPGVPRHQIDMNCIQVALLTYRNEFGQWPNGDTADILRALRGENVRQIKFLEMTDKGSGSMLDAWGTPYRVAIQSNTITVTSAGPNRTWHDKDDLEMNRTEPASPGDVATSVAQDK